MPIVDRRNPYIKRYNNLIALRDIRQRLWFTYGICCGITVGDLRNPLSIRYHISIIVHNISMIIEDREINAYKYRDMQFELDRRRK